MDYEKAYKEARERAKAFLGKGFRGEDLLVECVFPELKESEDERIRENIISWLKNIEGQTIPINEYNSALAWLEKQGEQKEQQPAEWSEDIKNWKNIVYYVLKEWNGIGQYLDNPELDEIAKELQKRYGYVSHIDTSKWSEEDERDIQEASEYLREYANNYVQGGNSKLYVQSLADRIDSLRPQPHWKPSKQQMESILDAMIPATGNTLIYLNSLYEQLKSL